MLGGNFHDTMDDTDSQPGSAGASGAGAGAGAAKAAWVVVLLLVGVAGVWAARQFAYQPDPAYAGEPGGRPMMLMFTADWCGPCQAFKAHVLSNPPVLDRLGRSCGFRTVDLTNWNGEPARKAKRYGVDSIPTLILVDSRGREISRYKGPRDPQSFGRWIDQNTR